VTGRSPGTRVADRSLPWFGSGLCVPGAQCSGSIGSLGPRLIRAGHEGVNLSRADRDYPYDDDEAR